MHAYPSRYRTFPHVQHLDSSSCNPRSLLRRNRDVEPGGIIQVIAVRTGSGCEIDRVPGCDVDPQGELCNLRSVYCTIENRCAVAQNVNIPCGQPCSEKFSD